MITQVLLKIDPVIVFIPVGLTEIKSFGRKKEKKVQWLCFSLVVYFTAPKDKRYQED